MSRLEKIFLNKYFVTVLWFGLSLAAVIKQVAHGHFNNYFIYKYVFINLTHQQNLYNPQPYYFDTNHYGPLFGLLIAPFSYLPDGFGAILWVLFNAAILYWAIWQLPFTINQRLAVLLICAHELMTAAFAVQFNPSMAAIIILSFVFVNRKQDMWATLLIVAGTMIKLYGIVGLAFFFFSKDKLRFIWTFIMWSVILFVLPMAISSPQFVVQSYHDWYVSLAHKNGENTISTMQDISVMGMIRRIFKYPQLSNAIVILPGMLLFATAYLRIKEFGNTHFRLLLLASTLIFTVIFSTGSESPTYIIAFTGVAIWFMNLDRPVIGFEVFLLVFALLITSLSPSDLFPKYINKHYIKPYAFKALPCFVIWLRIIYETLTRKFNSQSAVAPVAVQ
ncbi:glycosyltransferase family 87 protein [Mucilaginibacter sp. KACC 22063]|uniref:glycosyltransferase family 87 protein n=1 Tax=Mucilaginibacter sp. KACC 22063 TaxID=3025666 RepID=UPI00236574FC|nr:glycosyltransferase family 87 protein [Mucilaginibacter sp. KACC 22063]WDF53561.1 glycosyltransferase family 87 protein [Mucilaginibacter sp. KACC 22063]